MTILNIINMIITAGNIANAHFPLHKERGRAAEVARSAEAGARSPVDSEASLPGLMAVTRTSDMERDLKVGSLSHVSSIKCIVLFI